MEPPLPVGHGQRLYPRRRGLHRLGPGKVPLPGLRSFRRGSSGAWDRGGYALSLRPCCPQALLSSVGVGTGYALPPPPRLGAAWPQIQNIQPLPHAPGKSPARLACSVASALATARGRYHLFPGGGRGVARLDERPGFCVAFLALVEHPEGGRRQDAKRPEKRGAGGFDSGPRFLFGRPRGGPGAAPRPPNAAAPREAAPAFSLSPGNRRRAGGGALGNGERVAVGLRGGRRRFASPKGPQNQSMGGGQRPPPLLCARCARPPPPRDAGIFHRPNAPSTTPFPPRLPINKTSPPLPMSGGPG